MNSAKNLYQNASYTLFLNCNRDTDSGWIRYIDATVKTDKREVLKKRLKFDDIFLMDGLTNQLEVKFYGELAIVPAYSMDYDNLVDFMFYSSNGYAILDKNLNLVCHTKDGNIADKKDILKCLYLYGPSALVFIKASDYVTKHLKTAIKTVFAERIKNLKEKGALLEDINLEKLQFEYVVKSIEQEAQNDLGVSY